MSLFKTKPDSVQTSQSANVNSAESVSIVSPQKIESSRESVREAAINDDSIDLSQISSSSPEYQTLSPIQKAQIVRREKKASGQMENTERLDPIQKAIKNPNSLRAAITAKCFDCCGAGADPGVRQSVRDCSVTSCPLHHLRPWQNVHGKSSDQMTEAEFEESAGVEELVTEE